jgi:hypothetical protein
MKTKRILLVISIAAVSFTAAVAAAATRSGPMGMGSSFARPTARPAPAMTSGIRRFRNDGDHDFDDRFHRFRHFNNRTFVFVDAFGFPFYDPFFYGYYPYPYPYYYAGYPYYPYGGYGYGGGPNYGYGSDRASVADLQRRLARAGYYRGTIDGIMGPQTRRAMRAYRRDHNMPA